MPSALVFYHYLYPDDVVSSIHISELCAGLAAAGWDVTAMPCNRGCRDESKQYDSLIYWAGVRIQRVWRPRFRQASAVGRILNAAWMIGRWSVQALLSRSNPDVIIIGTDPILSIFTAIAWKRVRGKAVAHWCFDLYPEAAVADGILRLESRPVRMLRAALHWAYNSCDLIVDLGDCMRTRLGKYGSPAMSRTIVPWALVESARPELIDEPERLAVFGETSLALLYSGNFGLAHECTATLALARRLKDSGAKLVFSVRGNQVDALRSSVPPGDSNISFVPFTDEAGLRARLSCADIHVVSLRNAWTGTVVPSKFFGALAIGRPVLFEGSENSSIAKWIRQYQVGWVLNPETVEQVAAELLSLAKSPGKMRDLRQRCHAIYDEHFSRTRAIREWDAALRSIHHMNTRQAPPYPAGNGSLSRRP